MANVIKHKRGSGSDPVANNLVVGELAIRTDTGKLFTKMDSGALAEIAGGGSDIAINTLSSSSGTGGGSATFNGSAYRFTLSSPPSVSAQQLLVSINGVIQKPVAGTGQPSEGFSVDGSDIILGDAPATGSDFFILTFRSLGVSVPADNSVTSAKIVDGAIVNADINASAAIDGTKISPDFGSQAITTTGVVTSGTELIISGTEPRLTFVDTNNNPDFQIWGNAQKFQIFDSTNSQTRLLINSSGNVGIGTTSPGSVLHVDKGISGSPLVTFHQTNGNSSADAGLEVETSSTGTYIQRWVNSGSEKMRVTGNGLVGIGTTSPEFKLETNGEIASKNASKEFIALNLTNNEARIRSSFYSGASGAYRPITFFTSDSEKMRIDTSGHVGINTTTIGNKLQVHEASSNASFAGFSNDTTGSSSSDGLIVGLDSDENGVLYHYENKAIRFATNNTERMRIDSEGHVRFGSSGDASDVDWAHSTHGNTEVAIDGGGGYGALHFRGDGAGSTNTRFSMGVGDTKFYMAYDSVNNRHNIVVNNSGNVGLGTSSPTLLKGDGGRVLHLVGADNPEIVLERTTSGTEAKASIRITDTEDFRIAVKDGSASTIDALSIDSSTGNVVVGSTSANASDSCTLNSNGEFRGAGFYFSNNIGSPMSSDGIRRHTTGTMVFDTASAERMRIDSSGNVFLGKTASDVNNTGVELMQNNISKFTRNNGIVTTFNRGTNNGQLISLQRSGTEGGSIHVTTTSASFVSGSSDRSLKKNFEDWTENTLNLFKNLNPQKFNYIIEDDGAEKTKGYIAQDLVDSFPEAYPKNDNDKYMFNPSGMVVYLMKALQEAVARIEALEAK
tara:strand:- start:1901 stop:4429 length:2529 start_codon:yes stop_codon:yes gene_type:complete